MGGPVAVADLIQHNVVGDNRSVLAEGDDPELNGRLVVRYSKIFPFDVGVDGDLLPGLRSFPGVIPNRSRPQLSFYSGGGGQCRAWIGSAIEDGAIPLPGTRLDRPGGIGAIGTQAAIKVGVFNEVDRPGGGDWPHLHNGPVIEGLFLLKDDSLIFQDPVLVLGVVVKLEHNRIFRGEVIGQ